jgi:hypothetical protein
MPAARAVAIDEPLPELSKHAVEQYGARLRRSGEDLELLRDGADETFGFAVDLWPRSAAAAACSGYSRPPSHGTATTTG